MSENIPSDEDGVVHEQETPNEYDELAMDDEPDEEEEIQEVDE
jgi:hypothetical protein